MNNALRQKRIRARVLGLLGLQFLAVFGSHAADPAQTPTIPSSEAAPLAAGSSTKKPMPGCSSYDRCIALGKQLMDEKDARQAAEAFQQAAALAEQDEQQRAEAYGHLAVAKKAAGDPVAALAYLERARVLAPARGSWIESEYKQALASQGTLSAADIRRKLSLDKEIAQSEAPMQIAAAPEEETPGAAADDSEYTTEMGQTRGIGLDVATADDNTQYAPKPRAAAKPSARPAAPKPAVAAKPRVRRAPSRATGDGIASQPSLELRVNFQYNSADLTEEGARQTEELGKALRTILEENQGSKFILVGHTDMFGSEQYNLSLSKDRAESVRAYLNRSFPDLAGSLRAEGAGKRYPLFDTSDEESQKLNRRVEVKWLR